MHFSALQSSLTGIERKGNVPIVSVTKKEKGGLLAGSTAQPLFSVCALMSLDRIKMGLYSQSSSRYQGKEVAT